MRLVIFDIDGTLTQTMKVDADCFVRSLAEVCGFRDVDTDWSGYKHALIPVYYTRFTRLVADGFHRPSRFRGSASTSLVCLSRCPSKPLLPQSMGLLGCFLAWRTATSIVWRLLLGGGVMRHASRWPVPGRAMTITQRHRAMTPWTETRSFGYPL